jgi:hypothetical protein
MFDMLFSFHRKKSWPHGNAKARRKCGPQIVKRQSCGNESGPGGGPQGRNKKGREKLERLIR